MRSIFETYTNQMRIRESLFYHSLLYPLSLFFLLFTLYLLSVLISREFANQSEIYVTSPSPPFCFASPPKEGVNNEQKEAEDTGNTQPPLLDTYTIDMHQAYTHRDKENGTVRLLTLCATCTPISFSYTLGFSDSSQRQRSH